MMEQNTEYRQRLLEEYKEMAMPFLYYIPWLETKVGQPGSTLYHDPGAGEHSIGIPVFEGTLMKFVKEASASKLMDRNYQYVYTRNHIKSHEDERRLIASAEWKDWDLLRGILSYYVMGGMRKGILWSQALEEGIFLQVLKQMKSIIEFWDKPLEIR